MGWALFLQIIALMIVGTLCAGMLISECRRPRR